MRALVAGCGSIGFRHIRHLQILGLASIEAADPNPAARQKVQEQYRIRVHDRLSAALGQHPDIVLVCTPASSHVPVMLEALEAGAHIFVEKPLTVSVDGIDALERKVADSGRVVQVGYNLRFHPAMRAVKRLVERGRLGRILTAHAEFGLYLPKWWPERDYRTSYMVDPAHGGSLLLDASHEIDLLMWLLGRVREVAAMGDKLSALDIKGMDAIKVLLTMDGGVLASLHLDCLQPTYTRKLELIGAATSLRWDCPRGRADKEVGRLMLCEPDRDAFHRVRIAGAADETYVEELRAFLASVRAGGPPTISVEQGVAVLKVVAAIEEAIRTGRSVRL